MQEEKVAHAAASLNLQVEAECSVRLKRFVSLVGSTSFALSREKKSKYSFFKKEGPQYLRFYVFLSFTNINNNNFKDFSHTK